MRTKKQRLTVTVDSSLLQAASAAVRSGRAASVSAWVNVALEQHVERERRLRAMSDAISAYEDAHGVIAEDELERQRRADRRAAIRVDATLPKRVDKKKRSAA
jgi:hypothetical protein